MKDVALKEAVTKMERAIEAFERELSRVRTGRASLALLEGIKVSCYGSSMPLNQVASVAAPESRLLTIQPWDTNILGDIEKAILKSELGLTPNNDGKMIRVHVPPLTEARRKDLVKLIKKMTEECRVAVRNVRRDSIERLKGAKKDKAISEDEFFKLQDEVQKITDSHIKKVEEVMAAKEREILEF